MSVTEIPSGQHAGQVVSVTGLGPVRLLRALATSPETALYQTDQAGVVVKVFDLSCGKPDEVGYGPYMNFRAELATFEELQATEPLRLYVPTYYGASLDYDRKFAFIAMEFLHGRNLRAWAEDTAAGGYDAAALDELRRAMQEVLAIVDLFHRHGLVLMDFKPDNVIRLEDGTVRLVDLGAFFTPRHRREPGEFLYAATPDHAEVVIDVSNLQAGVPPGAASDIFSAGVALFEMATGASRLVIDPATAEEMLATPAMYRFRDSQIADVWKAFPHLKEALPLVQTQLRERRLLFSELWHLLKAYVGARVPDWEGLDPGQQGQILLATGTTFIQEQLPVALNWLAGPIAQATVLRSLRVKSMGELAQLLGNPAPEHVLADVAAHNCLLRHLERLGLPTDFAGRLNVWDTRLDRVSGHWAIAGPAACWELAENAAFVHLRRVYTDDQGHTYWHAVDEFEADQTSAGRANLAQLRHDHRAWLGVAVAGRHSF
jgi:hypothetical protein